VSDAPSLLSPCVGICNLSPSGYCQGCLRTLSEIERWSAMTERERHHCMNVLLPGRLRLAETG